MRNKRYAVWATSIDNCEGGIKQFDRIVDARLDKTFATKAAKNLRMARTPEMKKYRDNFEVKVVSVDDPAYLEYKVRQVIKDIKSEAEYEGNFIEALTKTILMENTIPYEDLIDWDFSRLKLTTKSSESISTYTHTSCWSTNIEGSIRLNETLYKGKTFIIGDVNRV